MTRLRYERQQRGWSQQTLGFHAQIQGTEICKIERGFLRPYPGQAQRLASALGIRPEQLLENVGGDTSSVVLPEPAEAPLSSS